MSDSVGPYRWQPTRLPRPWDSPSKNTGVGCHFLLQCMKVKNESEGAQSCLTLSHPVDCSPSGSSTHGIFQARVLECLGEDKYCKGGGWAEVQGLLNRKYIFPLLSCSHLSLYKGLFFFFTCHLSDPAPQPHYRPAAAHPRRKRWHPTPALLPRKSYGRRSLVGCSPWGWLRVGHD